mmetsp:Transcript_31322/g.93802  ORF Transcript_31322/g.93802 Transcript_31322/m.93802 type:complete len:252 (-) Transcript_31322:237-992(-)
MMRSSAAALCWLQFVLYAYSVETAFAWTPPPMKGSTKTRASARPSTRLFRYKNRYKNIKEGDDDESRRRRIYGGAPSSESSGAGQEKTEGRRASGAPGGSEAWTGAGAPRDELKPGEIPTLLMKALEWNDFPEIDSGLSSMWEFAGGNTKHVFKQNVTEFVESALETAETLPTSFYGVAMNGRSWEMETGINMVGGEGGWIATQVMKTVTSDGRVRRWQWELRKNRRPPCLGCWMVETIGSSDRTGRFEPE